MQAMQAMQSTQPTQPAQDLVQIQKKTATLDQLIANYNQLYKTYLQQVETEVNKQQERKYPYNIKNPNEFKNNLTPAFPFPSNGTEDACFKSCMDTKDCGYALYSNSGCGIDCNPNQCLLYSENAQGIIPVNEVPSVLPTCPVSGNADASKAWCKAFNNPVTNQVIPALVIRIGGTDWRTLAMQMPTSTANAADAPMMTNTTTNVQTWGPDPQFSDVNYAPANEISLQFRFFAEYWLNAYGIQSGSAPVIAGQGPIGTFVFSKLTTNELNATCNWKDTNQCVFQDYTMSNGACSVQGTNNPAYSVSGLAGYNASDFAGWIQALYNRNGGNDPTRGEAANVYNYWNKCKNVPGYEFLKNLNFANPGQASSNGGGTSYVGTFGGKNMFWNSANPSTGGTAAGQQTAAALAANVASAKFNRNYSAFEKPVWKTTANTNAMKGAFPPQLAKLSIPSWQYLGLQESAEACQRAAIHDPDHVYTAVTYYNASYSSNNNNAFANTCYGRVAGSDAVGGGGQEDNVQTMTPPYGYTKPGGKPGIAILKKMYQLNQQILALTDDLKINQKPDTNANARANANVKEGFAQQTQQNDPSDPDADIKNAQQRLSTLAEKLKKDEAKLNKTIQANNQLDMDEINTRQLLMYSRIKYVVAVVLGLLLAYFAYHFLTADELPATLETEMGISNAGSGSSMNPNSNPNSSDYGMDDLDMDSPSS